MPTPPPRALLPEAAPRRRRRKILLALLILLSLPVLALGAGIARMWPDPEPGFADRRGRMESVERGTTRRGKLVREDLSVRSTSGLEVEVAVLRPDAPGPHPLLVLLVGHKTGKEAVELFDDTGDTAVAAIRYPYDGKHRFGLLDGIAAIPSMQTALLDTSPAVMLALDALVEEPYVDAERIELVGVSLGALLGPRIAALDPRFRRVWLVHGAGDLVGLLSHLMKERIGAEGPRRVVAHALAFLAGAQHFAPEEWVGRISPRDLVFVNALEDERMPRNSVDALHAGAAEPHEIIWQSGGHVRVRREETVRALVELVLDRMAEDEP